jgi:hypothetical protein
MAFSSWGWKLEPSGRQLLLGDTKPRRLQLVGGGVGWVAGGAVVGGGVAGVLSEGDFLPQTESVEAARITANAETRERGPNFIHTSNTRATLRGPGNSEG